MKTFLIALGFSLICASSQYNPAEITGDWHTIFMAADNVEKINEGGVQRIYFRHFECSDGCNTLAINLYSKSSGECQKFSFTATKGPDDVYEAEYEGQNFFQIEYLSDGVIAFYDTNVDGDGKVTHMTVLVAKEDHVSEEQQKKFEELTVAKKIPKENIRNLIETDNCPAA